VDDADDIDDACADDHGVDDAIDENVIVGTIDIVYTAAHDAGAVVDDVIDDDIVDDHDDVNVDGNVGGEGDDDKVGGETE